ncbi:MAG: hypothetical protein E7311_07085 [Clostridiales bacterium]|nr:hypothetical protein [Clostridiales bacterium]
MISELIGYIYKILVFSILVVILDKLLPQGNSKKYVKLVSGFILTFIIISPILTFISKYDEVKDNVVSSIALLNIGDGQVASETMNNIDNQEYIDEVFKENMKLDLENRVKSYGYVAEDIKIEYNVNENKNYESIKNISFKITNAVEKEDTVEVIKVVNIQNESTGEEGYKIGEEEKNKVIEKLSSIYEISKENIHIM